METNNIRIWKSDIYISQSSVKGNLEVCNLYQQVFPSCALGHNDILLVWRAHQQQHTDFHSSMFMMQVRFSFTPLHSHYWVVWLKRLCRFTCKCIVYCSLIAIAILLKWWLPFQRLHKSVEWDSSTFTCITWILLTFFLPGIWVQVFFRLAWSFLTDLVKKIPVKK